MSGSSESNEVAVPPTETIVTENISVATEEKGKGKSIEPVVEADAMEDVESSSEDEAPEVRKHVRTRLNSIIDRFAQGIDVVEEPDEETFEEINPENILPDTKRTRGRIIDFAKASEDMGPEGEEEDDEDEDFTAVDDDEEMAD
ncbi:BgtAc-31294 [Blumeria graminis f. sp. tritici]|uniref:BgtAc-31294 n=2 Tax=Blumeria graminis f. sp. tritici TaxID=62690 RepID=A0A9X9MN90_BLUGR|nr:hypothetical protein BGT96224_Ac31294 [Blumeria graminis f. sp. tritici 96224]VDB93827.1 BgtAc-31294 [Blumeria graminis f. sp. tritici]